MDADDADGCPPIFWRRQARGLGDVIMRASSRPSRLLLNNSLGETFCHGSSSPIRLLGRLMRTSIVTDVTQFSAL
jgi:hypothetical protein